MKRRNHESKRLSLKVETLRRLQPLVDDDLGQVAGGAARKSAYCNDTTTTCTRA